VALGRVGGYGWLRNTLVVAREVVVGWKIHQTERKKQMNRTWCIVGAEPGSSGRGIEQLKWRMFWLN